jgi:hypothetical protein
MTYMKKNYMKKIFEFKINIIIYYYLELSDKIFEFKWLKYDLYEENSARKKKFA